MNKDFKCGKCKKPYAQAWSRDNHEKNCKGPRKLFKSKKGVLIFYIIFIIISIVILFMASVLAPLGVKINIKMYQAGEKILNSSINDIADIQDATVRTTLQTTVQNAQAATANNIKLNANLYRYSWILVIGLSALIIFILARVTVETQGRYGGGGII